MTDSRLFAATFDPNRWVTEDQASRLVQVLLPWVGPEQSDALAAALDRWESICLDTALLGMVLAHESGGYHNSLFWHTGGPSATTEAGWPQGLWLPPLELEQHASDVLRARLLPGQDSSYALQWARWQLDAWWNFVAAFEEGAEVSGTHADGSLVVTVAAAAGRASPNPVGEILYETSTFDIPQCAATWPRHVITDFGPDIQTRRCPLPASEGELTCRVHEAAGAL